MQVSVDARSTTGKAAAVDGSRFQGSDVHRVFGFGYSAGNEYLTLVFNPRKSANGLSPRLLESWHTGYVSHCCFSQSTAGMSELKSLNFTTLQPVEYSAPITD